MPEDPSIPEALTDPAFHEMISKWAATPWGLITTPLCLHMDPYSAQKESQNHRYLS